MTSSITPQAVARPGWVVLHPFDLTRDEGWQHTTGVRSTDSAYNRKAQTTFGPNGMAVHAERARAGATIYSSDAKAMFAPLPDYHRLEAVVGFTDEPLGMGMFPALWERPLGSGSGELDIWEYMPNHKIASLRTKTTLIKTGPVGGRYNMGSAEKSLGRTAAQMTARHTWAYEKVKGKVSVFWDDTLLASITAAEFDAKAGMGSWHAQIEAGHQWYARVTFQVGPPVHGGYNAAGTPPSTWRKTTYNVYSMTSYKPVTG